MTIDDSHDLHALAALGRPDGLAPALGAGEGGVDEGFPLVGKMLPDTLPLLIAQPQHETNSERSSSAGQQF